MAIRLEIQVDDRGSVEVKKFADTARKETKDAAQKMEKNIGGAGNSIVASFKKMSSGAKLFAGVAASAAVVSLGNLVKRTIEAQDRIGKLSLRLGESTEFLSEMAFVAERSGVSVETMNMAIQRANRRLAEFAATGKGPAAEAFKQLGIDVRNADGTMKSFEQLLPELADAFQKIESEAEKTRLAFQLFDSEGVSFLQILKGGSAEIEKLRQKARDLGLSLNKEVTDQAAAANDALTDFSASMQGLGNAVIPVILPALTSLANTFTKVFQKIREAHQAVVDFFTDENLGNLKDVAEATAKQWDLASFNIDDFLKKAEKVAEQQREAAEQARILNTFSERIDFGNAVRGSLELKENMKMVNEQLERGRDIIKEWEQQQLGIASELVGYTNMFADAIARSAVYGKNLADELERAARAAAQSILSRLIAGAFGAAVGALIPGVGPAAGFAIGSGLRGFQHGGSFVVPGAGGPDNQIVAFRASPGERVIVQPQHTTNNNMPININITTQRLDRRFVETELIGMLNKVLRLNGAQIG